MSDIFKLAKQKGCQAEIFKSALRSATTEVRNGEVSAANTIADTGIGLRIIKDQKLGFAWTTDFPEASIEDLLDSALANAANTEADPFYGFASAPKYEPLKTYDRDISNLRTEDRVKFALLIEESAYKASPKVKKTEKSSFSTQEVKIEISNSDGLNISYHANHCGGFCEVIAKEGAEQESGFSLNYAANLKDFDAAFTGKEAAQHATELLGAKPISSQKLPLILDPYVGAQLLGSISQLFSSDAVQKGKSLFANKLEKAVANKIMSIIDDGRLKNGLMSAPVDDEGIPTQKTILIENGTLNNYLYNAYTARKDEKKSTGSGRRSSYKSLPEVSPGNIYIAPGTSAADSIIGKVSMGLYITRVMGMHTVNPISGDFSIGAAGIMIENGGKTYPVRGITVAGNLIEFLQSIEEIGSDLRFFPFSANLGSPTLLVANIAVSG